MEIFAVDIRSPQRVTQITHLPGMVLDASWSPDGTRVAFRWFRPSTGRPSIWVANADGSHQQLLIDNASTPAWSPEGSVIAFSHVTGIALIDIEHALGGDRSSLRDITRAFGPQEYPNWSPDGKRLLFSGYGESGSYDIWVVNADGSGLHDLTPQPSLEYGASWSPDGRSIVFGSNRGLRARDGGDLYLMHDDGSGVRRLTRTGKSFSPAWSPDGRLIAFNSHRTGRANDIYLMRSDGTSVRRITTNRAEDMVPRWVGRCSS